MTPVIVQVYPSTVLVISTALLLRSGTLIWFGSGNTGAGLVAEVKGVDSNADMNRSPGNLFLWYMIMLFTAEPPPLFQGEARRLFHFCKRDSVYSYPPVLFDVIKALLTISHWKNVLLIVLNDAIAGITGWNYVIWPYLIIFVMRLWHISIVLKK